MNSTRLVGIPIDHIIAEVAAFPLVSEASLRLCTTRLDPDLSRSRETATLWRHAERHLVSVFPGFSLDELVAIRDRLWFAEARGSDVPLARYLFSLSRMFLEGTGTYASPRLPRQECENDSRNSAVSARARSAWRWLSLALPSDLLLAPLHAGPGRAPQHVDLVSPWLDRLLRDNGFAETHLHVGVALDFILLWNSVLYAIASPRCSECEFSSPGAGLAEGELLAPWLVRAAIARYVLAGYLADSSGEGFLGYLHGELKQRVAREMGVATFSVVIQLLAELEFGALAPDQVSFASLQSVYMQLAGISGSGFPEALERARVADPIVPLLPEPGGQSANPDLRFELRGIRYLQHRTGLPDADTHFERLFWQVIRVRNLFFRHVVQRPMTPGLQWFVRFYNHSSPARKPIRAATSALSAAHIEGAGRGLRSLEIRTSPDASISEMLRYVQDLDSVALSFQHEGRRPQREALEIGLVLHFTKVRGKDAMKGKPGANWQGMNADPEYNQTGYRYANFYLNKREEARALEWLLRHWPLSQEVVRGLDVCTDELGVPNWVLAPILLSVRQANAEGAVAWKQLGGRPPPPLRTTVHSGEDFVHLLTGLRLVDQAIEQFQLKEGDRIGHGLALGVDPLEWAQRAGRLPIPKEQRLLDLTWEWSWYGRPGAAPERARWVFLEHEIARLSRALFGEPLAPFILEELLRDLCDPWKLYAVGFPYGHVSSPDLRRKSIRLLYRYLTDQPLFKRGHEIMWIDPDSEGESLAQLQAELRAKLGALGLVVEVNPTSNLLIGDLSDLSKHPLWRLRPPRGDGGAPPVSVCIGSDDPLVFASNLREEYQCLADAMALAGLSDEEARRWLDRTRECGLESRFTLCRSRRGYPVTAVCNCTVEWTPLPI